MTQHLLLFSPRFSFHRNARGKTHLSVTVEYASIRTLWTLCGKEKPPVQPERMVALDLVCKVCLTSLQAYQRGTDYDLVEVPQAPSPPVHKPQRSKRRRPGNV